MRSRGRPEPMLQTLDHTKPTIAGARPRAIVMRHGDAEKRCHNASNATMIKLDGRNIAAVATAAPRYGRPGVAA